MCTAVAITAGGVIGGKIIESAANRKSAELQAQTSREALEYAKEEDKYRYKTEGNRYAALRAGLDPYVEQGYNSAQQGGEAMGLPPLAPRRQTEAPPTYANETVTIPGEPTFSRTTGPPLSHPMPGQPGGPPISAEQRASAGMPPAPPAPDQGVPSPPSTGGSAMVTLRAPDGSIKQVPASELAHWQSKGAQVVG